MVSKEAWFQEQKDRIRKRLLKYTRKAFRMLPRLDKPRILDIGCGSGVPTLELARLSDGEIVGLDIDKDMLDVLQENIEKAGLSDRVKVINRSLLDMDFPDEGFDVIWAEGSINVIGFKKGLQEWKRFLKPGGFMVVHDERGNVREKLEQISSCGYQLLGYFGLNEKTWWTEYFVPLEKLISEARVKYPDAPGILEAIRNAQREIDMFKEAPERNSSVCFVMQRRRRKMKDATSAGKFVDDSSIEKRTEVNVHEFKERDFEHPSALFVLEDMLKGLIGGPLLYNPYFKTFGLNGAERVLDFGCGGGAGSRNLLKFLSQKGRLTCVDTSEFWIDKARRRLGKYGNVVCLAGDIRTLDIADSTFDVISVFHVIHDIPPAERRETVKALSGKLKASGMIFVREPTKKSHGMPVDEILDLFSEAGLQEAGRQETKSEYIGRFQKLGEE
jgi:ubiquinone/menaquinone biosynthesis C-methylase UbiE